MLSISAIVQDFWLALQGAAGYMTFCVLVLVVTNLVWDWREHLADLRQWKASLRARLPLLIKPIHCFLSPLTDNHL